MTGLAVRCKWFENQTGPARLNFLLLDGLPDSRSTDVTRPSIACVQGERHGVNFRGNFCQLVVDEIERGPGGRAGRFACEKIIARGILCGNRKLGPDKGFNRGSAK
jgi:hypothetical protein